MKNYRLWLVVSCAGLVGLWYVFMVLLFLGANVLSNTLLPSLSPGIFTLVFLIGAEITLMLASLLSLPIGKSVFKRLKIQAPLVSALAFFMALVFGVNLFVFVVGLTYFDPSVMYLILASSMIFAGLLYGIAVRPLKHKLSHKKFIIVVVGLSIMPAILYMLWRILVIKSF